MRSFLVLAVLGMLFMSQAVASANVLSDPGFEGTGAGPWGGSESTSGVTRNFDSTSVVHGGLQSFSINLNNVGGYIAGTAEQNVNVSAGQAWDSSVYARVTDTIENGDAFLETWFFDSSWNKLSTEFKSTDITDAGNWTLLTTSGIVPTGAVIAQVRLVGQEWGAGSGTVNFDDAVATIPEPTSMILLGSGLAGLLGFSRKKK